MATAQPADASNANPNLNATDAPRFGRLELLPVVDLPEPSTPLIGRTSEVDEISALLIAPETRLVTLAGPGGIGKTRLAIEVATRLLPSFADGARFVDLTPIDDQASVLPEIAQRLGVRDWGDQPLGLSLRAFLRQRRLLLVLDNFERVVEAGPAVAEVIAGCPGVVVLVTSRAVLRLNIERVYPVPPLDLPPANERPTAADVAGCEAVRLFVVRASFAQPTFALTDANATVIAEIVRRLDGLPLALELAAARTRMLPAPALLNRLERRLPVLTDGPRDLPARQQTLRRAIAWSYDLLSPDEQSLFGHLAVFSGGFDLDVAEAVCGSRETGDGRRELDDRFPLAPVSRLPSPVSPDSVLDGVSSLLDKSLVQQVEGGNGTAAAQPRFRLLETIREFALDVLEASGRADAVRLAHAAVYLALAKRFARSAWVPQAEPSVDRLETEHANLRAALQWFEQTGDAARMLEMVVNLWWFWSVRGYLREGREWIERALRMEGGNDPPPRALAHIGLGRLWHYQGNEVEAANNYNQALQIAREGGSPLATVFALSNLGALAAYEQKYEQAMRFDEEALALMPSLSDAELAVSLTSATLSNSGYTYRGLGQYTLAEERLGAAIAGFRAMGYAWGLIRALHHGAGLARTREDNRLALDRYAECFALAVETGDERMIAGSLIGLATVAGVLNDHPGVAHLLGAADASQARLATSFVVSPLDQEAHDTARAAAEKALGVQHFADLQQTGRSWPRAEVAERVGEAIQQLRGRPRSTTPEAEIGLSARELDVVPLLVEGLSDKEIAERLQIGVRTAQGHVASIMAKFGVHNRTAAASAAVAAGLATTPLVS